MAFEGLPFTRHGQLVFSTSRVAVDDILMIEMEMAVKALDRERSRLRAAIEALPSISGKPYTVNRRAVLALLADE